MSKILTTILLFIFTCMVLFSYDVLPEKSVNFINDYFNYDDIIINFDLYRYLLEVNGNTYPIPMIFTYKKALNIVNKTNPNASNINKIWNMYVISLDNYVNIFIDFAGMIIG